MIQLSIFVASFSCAFHILAADAQRHCLNFDFSRHLDMRLRCGIYRTYFGFNLMKCQKKCAKKVPCFSVNFYHDENGKSICELIKGTMKSFGNKNCIVHKKGSEHDERKYSRSCLSPVSCAKHQIRKALPGNWFQLDSSAFKLFEHHKNHAEASGLCSADGGALATINSKIENDFVVQMYLKEKLSKRATIIEQTLKPFKHWKLDGSDKGVTVFGNLVAEKEENISAALHFTGTAGSYATTPAWPISVMTFSIAIWFKLEEVSLSSIYSYWGSPYIFMLFVSQDTRLRFIARKKQNHMDLLFHTYGRQVDTNQWIHVVAVWDRATKLATLYQDGSKVSQSVPLATSEVDLPTPTRTVFDLGYKRDDGRILKGWLRALLIFDRAVTSEEVKIIQDLTSLVSRTWIGAQQDYLNMTSVPQKKTNCLSVTDWWPYQWEEIPCDQRKYFICKKTV